MSDRPGTPIAVERARETAPAARQVCGLFHDHERLEEAVSWLEGALFVRADMSVVRERHDERGEEASEPLGAAAAESGQQQVSAPGEGIAGALADLAAGGVAVLTGAAASVAIASAAGASGGVVAAAHAPGRAAATDGRAGADRAAAPEGVILAVRADRPCEAERAEEVLLIPGAAGIWTQDRPR